MLTPGNINGFTASYDGFKGFLARMERLSWHGRLFPWRRTRATTRAGFVDSFAAAAWLPVIAKRRAKEGKRTRNPGFDRTFYRQRNVVERCLGGRKEHRRVVARYDQLAATYSAMVQLACLRRLLPRACAA